MARRLTGDKPISHLSVCHVCVAFLSEVQSGVACFLQGVPLINRGGSLLQANYLEIHRDCHGVPWTMIQLTLRECIFLQCQL